MRKISCWSRKMAEMAFIINGGSLGDFVADVFYESLKCHVVHAHDVLKRPLTL